MTSLFSKAQLGRYSAQHRIVLAPMTRIRANRATLAPTPLTATYYAQRATPGGLLITEATHISPEATPIWTIYPKVRKSGDHVPGIWTQLQTDAWRQVTDAVHAKGGLIFCQLLHTGRVAQPEIGTHPIVQGTDAPLPPISASAMPIVASAEVGNQYNWDDTAVPPRAATQADIQRIIADYQQAARNALAAGFDGIELHAAHGYLIDQFLCDGVNQRTDSYGGTLANRCRFLFEVVAALVAVMGADRVGVRLSPLALNPATGLQTQTYFGVTCSDPVAIQTSAIQGLNQFRLAYLLLTEPRVGGLSAAPDQETAYTHPLRNTQYRDLYQGTLIGAGGFTPATAADAVAAGHYDLIAFGRWFLANPDLPTRIKHGYPLNVYQRDTFYGGNAAGYTDYPTWENRHQSAYPHMHQHQLRASLQTAKPSEKISSKGPQANTKKD